MFYKKLQHSAHNFLRNRSGEFAMQAALMFGVLAVAGALVAVPLLDKGSREFAAQNSYGIDPITTASTRSRGKGNTYTTRRSVLREQVEIICRTPNGGKC